MTSRTPTTPAEIAAALRSLSRRMIVVGTSMDYYGGFDGRMAARGAGLIGAGHLARGWADAIETGASKAKEGATCPAN